MLRSAYRAVGVGVGITEGIITLYISMLKSLPIIGPLLRRILPSKGYRADVQKVELSDVKDEGCDFAAFAVISDTPHVHESPEDGDHHLSLPSASDNSPFRGPEEGHGTIDEGPIVKIGSHPITIVSPFNSGELLPSEMFGNSQEGPDRRTGLHIIQESPVEGSFALKPSRSNIDKGHARGGEKMEDLFNQKNASGLVPEGSADHKMVGGYDDPLSYYQPVPPLSTPFSTSPSAVDPHAVLGNVTPKLEVESPRRTHSFASDSGSYFSEDTSSMVDENETGKNKKRGIRFLSFRKNRSQRKSDGVQRNMMG